MVGLSVSSNNPSVPGAGLRPVNLRTDLGALASLIELAFADVMDANGRAAIREMRYLSKMGPGLRVLAGLNELAQGIGLGFVWIANGELVGNVSVYSADWPPDPGRAWIIANVAVHPDYQGQGIAKRMMQASTEMIRERGGHTVILQVDTDNEIARHLYRQVGFFEERSWIQWTRSDSLHVPPPLNTPDVHIVTRKPYDWEAEYALAQRIRPAHLGGMGWLQPLHPGLFRKSFWQRVTNMFNPNRSEYLLIRSHDGRDILASLRIDAPFGSGRTKVALMIDTPYQEVYAEPLINLAVRRFGRIRPLSIEHPADEEMINAVLRRYHFRPRRSVTNMRWDID